MNKYSAIACIIGSCISLQLGAALAVHLFPVAGAWGTASARLLVAGTVLCLIARPKFTRWTWPQWRAILMLGLSMGAMNGFFYNGLSRVPLGSAVTIEFIGPLALAALLSRSHRDATCVALAVAGMSLLGWQSLGHEPLDPLGVAYVLCAALFWALYIVAGRHAGQQVAGQGGLGVAILLGGLALLPMGGAGVMQLTSSVELVVYAVGTGLLASLVPYSLELIALRRLKPMEFSIFIALEPVFAAFFGWLLLAEHVGPLKAVAITLVVCAAVAQTVWNRRAV